MKVILFSGGLFYLIFAYNPFPNLTIKKQAKYRGIKLEVLVSLLDGQEVSGYDTTANFFFYQENITIFKFAYTFDSMLNNNSVKSEVRYNYLVYAKGEKYGIFYNSHDSALCKKVLVDSLLEIQAFGKLNIDTVLTSNELVLLNDTSRMKDQTQKIYIKKSKFDKTQNDSIILSFSKELNWVDFSFSKKMDSILGMKLSKIIFSLISPTDKEHLKNLVNAKVIIELSEIKQDVYTSELDYYLNNYNKHKKILLN